MTKPDNPSGGKTGPGKLSAVRQARSRERHAAVLAEALELIGERGYHGASLRELAKRLGISQPSLYHYFATKEELVEQIIDAYSERMFEGRPPPNLSLEELAVGLGQYVMQLYSTPSHPTFVRFMFAVSRIDPRFGRRLREVFEVRTRAFFAHDLAALALANGLDPEHLGHVFRAQINALALRLMEQTVLFDEQPISADVHIYAEQVTQMTLDHIAALRSRARTALPARARDDAGRD